MKLGHYLIFLGFLESPGARPCREGHPYLSNSPPEPEQPSQAARSKQGNAGLLVRDSGCEAHAVRCNPRNRRNPPEARITLL